MARAEIEAKLDEMVAFAEVEKFIDPPVKRYSSGMYLRLAFAVAAHLDPDILLIDEVLAVGDAGFQRKCLGTIGRAARRPPPDGEEYFVALDLHAADDTRLFRTHNVEQRWFAAVPSEPGSFGL